MLKVKKSVCLSVFFFLTLTSSLFATSLYPPELYRSYLHVKGHSFGAWPQYLIKIPTVTAQDGIVFNHNDQGSSTISLHGGRTYFLAVNLSVNSDGQRCITDINLQTNESNTWKHLAYATDEGMYRASASLTYIYTPLIDCKVRIEYGTLIYTDSSWLSVSVVELNTMP